LVSSASIPLDSPSFRVRRAAHTTDSPLTSSGNYATLLELAEIDTSDDKPFKMHNNEAAGSTCRLEPYNTD